MAKNYRTNTEYRNSLTYRGHNIVWAGQDPVSATWAQQTPNNPDTTSVTQTIGVPIGLLLALTYAVTASSTTSVWSQQNPTSSSWSEDTPTSASWSQQTPTSSTWNPSS